GDDQAGNGCQAQQTLCEQALEGDPCRCPDQECQGTCTREDVHGPTTICPSSSPETISTRSRVCRPISISTRCGPASLLMITKVRPPAERMASGGSQSTPSLWASSTVTVTLSPFW